MSGAAIVFDQVWKKYRRGERHDSLRDLVPALGRRLLRRRSAGVLDRQEFWAVRDVSFAVEPGEALGIIGPNGAGKSTILKLLTKIIRPTRGHCEVRGRIGSLIEVSAAFHPDLTGRENVFLQGGIMGMRRAEITRKFDEIVDFSGIAEFIDTPVKRYSSGMHARLGFSIAAHLETDVLIIDEVLSVGDYAFQQKALDRIKALVKQHMPVVIVSHQLENINQLCNKAILLRRGAAVCVGSPSECINRYVSDPASTSEAGEVSDQDRLIRIDAIAVTPEGPIQSGSRVTLHISGTVARDPGDRESVSVRIQSLATHDVASVTGSTACGVTLPSSGPFELRLSLQMNLPPGLYLLETITWDRRLARDSSRGPAVTIEVEQGVYFWGSAQLNPRMQLVRPELAGAADGPRAAVIGPAGEHEQ